MKNARPRWKERRKKGEIMQKSTPFLGKAENLKDFLQKDENVLFAFIFGSCVKGRQHKQSDIDIGIYFKKPLEGFAILEYINKLSELTGREVDLVILNSASALLRHQVMKYREPLVIKDRNEYVRFRERTISDYDEYKYISGMNVYVR